MDEKFIENIYKALGYDKKGVDYNIFLTRITNDDEFKAKIFTHLGYDEKGVDYEIYDKRIGRIRPEGSFQEYTAALESTPSKENHFGYSAVNDNALGAYQIKWSWHGDEIKKLTDAKNEQDFINNPLAQEAYMGHLIEKQYKPNLPALKELSEKHNRKYNDYELMYLMHHEGVNGAKSFIEQGGEAERYDLVSRQFEKGKPYAKEIKPVKAIVKFQPIAEEDMVFLKGETLEGLNIKFKDNISEDGFKVSRRLANLLKNLPQEFNDPDFVVTSLKRTKEENDALALSAEDSFHLSGDAVDVRWRTEKGKAFAKFLSSDEGKDWLKDNNYRHIVHGKGDNKHIHLEPVKGHTTFAPELTEQEEELFQENDVNNIQDVRNELKEIDNRLKGMLVPDYREKLDGKKRDLEIILQSYYQKNPDFKTIFQDEPYTDIDKVREDLFEINQEIENLNKGVENLSKDQTTSGFSFGQSPQIVADREALKKKNQAKIEELSKKKQTLDGILDRYNVVREDYLKSKKAEDYTADEWFNLTEEVRREFGDVDYTKERKARIQDQSADILEEGGFFNAIISTLSASVKSVGALLGGDMKTVTQATAQEAAKPQLLRQEAEIVKQSNYIDGLSSRYKDLERQLEEKYGDTFEAFKQASKFANEGGEITPTEDGSLLFGTLNGVEVPQINLNKNQLNTITNDPLFKKFIEVTTKYVDTFDKLNDITEGDERFQLANLVTNWGEEKKKAQQKMYNDAGFLGKSMYLAGTLLSAVASVPGEIFEDIIANVVYAKGIVDPDKALAFTQGQNIEKIDFGYDLTGTPFQKPIRERVVSYKGYIVSVDDNNEFLNAHDSEGYPIDDIPYTFIDEFNASGVGANAERVINWGSLIYNGLKVTRDVGITMAYSRGLMGIGLTPRLSILGTIPFQYSNDFVEESVEAGMGFRDAHNLAIVRGIKSGLINMINPLEAAVFSSGLGRANLEVIRRLPTRTQKIKAAADMFFKQQQAEFLEEEADEWTDVKLLDIVDAGNMNIDHNAHFDPIDTGILTFFGTAGPAIAASISRYKELASDSFYRQSLYQAVNNIPKFEAILDNLVADGTLTEAQAKVQKDRVNKLYNDNKSILESNEVNESTKYDVVWMNDMSNILSNDSAVTKERKAKLLGDNKLNEYADLSLGTIREAFDRGEIKEVQDYFKKNRNYAGYLAETLVENAFRDIWGDAEKPINQLLGKVVEYEGNKGVLIKNYGEYVLQTEDGKIHKIKVDDINKLPEGLNETEGNVLNYVQPTDINVDGNKVNIFGNDYNVITEDGKVFLESEGSKFEVVNESVIDAINDPKTVAERILEGISYKGKVGKDEITSLEETKKLQADRKRKQKGYIDRLNDIALALKFSPQGKGVIGRRLSEMDLTEGNTRKQKEHNAKQLISALNGQKLTKAAIDQLGGKASAAEIIQTIEDLKENLIKSSNDYLKSEIEEASRNEDRLRGEEKRRQEDRLDPRRKKLKTLELDGKTYIRKDGVWHSLTDKIAEEVSDNEIIDKLNEKYDDISSNEVEATVSLNNDLYDKINGTWYLKTPTGLAEVDVSIIPDLEARLANEKVINENIHIDEALGNITEGGLTTEQANVILKLYKEVYPDKTFISDFDTMVEVMRERGVNPEIIADFIKYKPPGTIIGDIVYVPVSEYSGEAYIHELSGHAFYAKLKNNNTERAKALLKRAHDLAKMKKPDGSSYYNDIRNSEFYKKRAEEISRNATTETQRAKLIEDYYLEEAVATMIGNEGKAIIENASDSTFNQTLKNFLTDFYNFLKELFGINFLNYTPEQLSNLTVDEFTKVWIGSSLNETALATLENSFTYGSKGRKASITPEGWLIEGKLATEKQSESLDKKYPKVREAFSTSDIPKFMEREFSVYMTPATIREFNEETRRLKDLTDRYNKIGKELQAGNYENESLFPQLEKDILDTYENFIKNEVFKIRGVEVRFGNPYMGSWRGDYEPSFNMKIRVSENADTQKLSELLFNLAERTSQDAFILEEKSELEGLVLTEFTDDGYTHYPQFEINFEKDLTLREKSKIALSLHNSNINEFSIDGDYFIINLIDFESQTELEKDAKYEQTRNTLQAIFEGEDRKIGENNFRHIKISTKKSRYVGARNEGSPEQERWYDKSDLFEKGSTPDDGVVEAPKFLMPGEVGIRNNPIALYNLSKARKLESDYGLVATDWLKKGYKTEDKRNVLIQTGFQRGADLKWRYEIPDDFINKIKLEAFFDESKLTEDLTEFKLSQVAERNLARFYPKLADINVKIINDVTEPKGKFDGTTITLNNAKLADLSTLYHEMQHYIQMVEGFAPGGSARTIREYVIQELEVLEGDITLRRDYIEHLSKQDFPVDFIEELRRELDYMEKSEATMREALYNDMLFEKEGYHLYRRIAGEDEANNIQRRMKMPFSERYALLLEETTDLALEDQIVLYHDFAQDVRFMTTPNGENVKVKAINVDVVNGFYSPLEKIISESKQDKMPVKQWKEKFAKGEEAKWTGLTDWLSKQTGSVSKVDIQNYLKENRIEIVEVVKEEKNGEWYKNEEGYERWRELDNTNFSQYQLEGEKESYKEVLVTLPKPAFKKGEWVAVPVEIDGFSGKETIWRLKNKNTGQESVGAYETKALAESEIKKGEREGGKTDFQSTHFEEPNILVHLRMNTRTDVDGNKILMIEELQSDYNAAYRQSQKKINDYIAKNEDEVIELYKKSGKLRVEC